MEPPIKPNESDCCNSGCNPCILDVYEEQLRKYETNKNKLDTKSRKNCISQTSYTIFKLSKITTHICNTLLLTFEACVNDRDDLTLTYKPGQHFLLKGHSLSDKNQFTRAYTPIPFDGAANTLSFIVVVKLYEDGCMSEYIRRLKVGDKTLWRGPYGDYQIKHNFERILCIAQGTGIAPIFAVIKEILANFDCDTFIKLYFCCRTDKDILLRNELYSLASYWNFSYEIFLSNCNNVVTKYNEIVHTNRLNFETIKGFFVKCNKSNTQVLICGSEMFNKDISKQVLDCEINSNKIYLF